MASPSILSRGCLRTIIEDPYYASWFWQTPRVQCIHVKTSPPGDENAGRKIVVLSDGINFLWAMLSSTLCTLLDRDGEHVVKGVLVVTTMHVATRFGALPKIGRPGRLDVVLPLLDDQIWFDARRTGASDGGRLFSMLPTEVLHLVLAHLDQVDTLSLAMTAKMFHALVGGLIPSQVSLTSEQGISKFAEAMNIQPGIRNVVRSYSVKVNGAAPAAHVQIVQDLPLLRDCHIEVEHTSGSSFLDMLPVLQRLLSSQTSQCLKSFHLVINPSGTTGWTDDAQSNILHTLFLAPSIPHLAVSYRTRSEDEANHVRVRPLTFRPPVVSAHVANATRLQSLNLQWEGLQLPALAILLRLHRKLHTLKLVFSSRARRVSTSLDAALAPLAETLQTLHIRITDLPSIKLVGLRWGPRFLSPFGTLQHLRLPAAFLAYVISQDHVNTVDGDSGSMAETADKTNVPPLWLPPSLISICFNTATLDEAPADRDPGNESISTSSATKSQNRSRQPQSVTTDPATTSALTYVCTLLHNNLLPRFRDVVFDPDSHQHTLNPLTLRVRPPILCLEEGLRPLVDRGIRTVVEFESFEDTVLQVRCGRHVNKHP
ncbi:uncharacterized protein DSM5745_03657 [Aspergillus mulundensis]|uniref:F-box domain-containing protein n=1 Tax=Aspergillus mulundensis TaxID=1810919 RepID=A0A3D8SL02_9EURO|nr:hypothetical protein DSM5745_03657 [Aspergillus mulundensis]RDW87015.1 hypothetical protein DSM5745_03657 [Aspergillus mulundensis]